MATVYALDRESWARCTILHLYEALKMIGASQFHGCYFPSFQKLLTASPKTMSFENEVTSLGVTNTMALTALCTLTSIAYIRFSKCIHWVSVYPLFSSGAIKLNTICHICFNKRDGYNFFYLPPSKCTSVQVLFYSVSISLQCLLMLYEGHRPENQFYWLVFTLLI